MTENLNEIDKAIIRDYVKVGNEKFYNEFGRKLEKNQPSLRFIFSELKNNSNPVENLEKIKNQLSDLKKEKKDLDKICNSPSVSPLEKGRQTLIEYKKDLDNLYNLAEKCSEMLPLIEIFYSNLPRYIKEVSLEHKVTIKEVINQIEYRDKVMKKIIPERKNAEKIIKASSNFLELIIRKTRNNLKAMENSPFKEKVKKYKEKIPSKKVFESFKSAITKYCSKELDRIYKQK